MGIVKKLAFVLALFTVTISSSLLVLTNKVSAAEDDGGFNLITSPLPINLTGKPGQTLKADIKVKNGSNHPEKLKVTLMKFSASGEEGKPAIADRGKNDDYFDWVTFSPQTFDAPTNEWITVVMTIKLPPSAAFGYYYAAAFSRASDTTAQKANTLLGSTAVLALVNAEVQGAKREATIKSFTLSKKTYEFLPANFTIKVRNTGNIHLVPAGNIFISKGGKTVATLKVNSAGGNVLPQTNRIFTSEWEDGFPSYVKKEIGGQVVLDENDKSVSTLKWDFTKISKLRFGHYTAHLFLAYDNGQRDVPMEATLSFWVVPWRILGGLLMLLILTVLGLWSIGRPIIRKIRRRHEKTYHR